jgi:hypothetical protein
MRISGESSNLQELLSAAGVRKIQRNKTASGGLKMSRKNGLTILHCVIGPLITIGCMGLSASIAREQPLLALILMFGSVVAPFFITTRVAWAAGYAAGQNSIRQGLVESELVSSL